MTQEDKNLLLKDLCARLPYGVKCVFLEKMPEWFISKYGGNESAKVNFTLSYDNFYSVVKEISIIKPYLRPMSSLIGKELDECRATCKYRQVGQSVLDCATPQTIDYLISHHFDYRGLIPIGLALEATEEMYIVEETVGVKETPTKTFPRINEFYGGSSYRG